MASRGAARAGRGGYQRPSKPAAASGPGKLSERTDRGQPVRPIPSNRPGGQHGDRKASVEQQQAAPLRAGGPAAPGAGAGGAPPGDPMSAPPPGVSPDMVFGPSNRPWEPVTAGAQLGPGPGVAETDEAVAALRAAYQITQSPWLLRLLGSFDG